MKTNTKTLGILCWLVYFASYVTRVNFGAVISEIVFTEGFLKSAAGVVTTAGFVSYGIGQIISGYLGDKTSPKRLIFMGLIATSVLNLSIPFCKSIDVMSVIWFLNGFAQAMMWPPLVKIMAMHLNDEMYRKTVVNVAIASFVGTIFVYLMAPLCIAVYGWRLMFFVCALVGLTVAFVWLVGGKGIRDKGETKEKHMAKVYADESVRKAILSSGLIFITIGVLLQGILKDGITTWMPSLISETYRWESKAAIVTTVILPVFSMFSVKLVALVQKKYFNNDLVCATVFYAAGFFCCGLLYLFFSKGPVLSIFFAALITAFMHGVNLMLISNVPKNFERYGRVSMVSGVLNFFAYVGSALSSYGIAKLSEMFNWSFTLLIWMGVALIGTIICLFNIKRWRVFATTKTTLESPVYLARHQVAEK